MESNSVVHSLTTPRDGGGGGAGTEKKRSFVDAGLEDDPPSPVSSSHNSNGSTTLRPENRSLPHKKRRPPAPVDEQVLQASKSRLKSLTDAASACSSGPAQQQQQQQPPAMIKSPTSSTTAAAVSNERMMQQRNKDNAWMHRLYPFDGPSIEEFTTLFKDVDLEQLVQGKLSLLKDRFLAELIKIYYDKVIQMDHFEYKNAERPPHGTPDDIRPFLLSRHQLKSFNSDFLRSALRKTKVNKSFCTLLRSSSRVIGVPTELQQLGNEAFARSIRTHQIIAFFMRYYSLYATKYPGKVLNLNDNEHRLLLDCLKDIMRRVTAKKVIQRAVVEHGNGSSNSSRMTEEPVITGDAIAGVMVPSNINGGGHGFSSTVPTTDTDEKENKSSDYYGGTTISVVDLSFDSTTTNMTTTTSSSFATDTTSGSSPGLFSPISTGGGGGDRSSESTSYNDVLALLSTDARQAVEAMVDKLKQKVHEEATRQVCQRSFEEGRKVGRMEGRMMSFSSEDAKVEDG